MIRQSYELSFEFFLNENEKNIEQGDNNVPLLHFIVVSENTSHWAATQVNQKA